MVAREKLQTKDRSALANSVLSRLPEKKKKEKKEERSGEIKKQIRSKRKRSAVHNRRDEDKRAETRQRGQRNPARNLKKKASLGSVCPISLIKKSSIVDTDAERKTSERRIQFTRIVATPVWNPNLRTPSDVPRRLRGGRGRGEGGRRPKKRTGKNETEWKARKGRANKRRTVRIGGTREAN